MDERVHIFFVDIGRLFDFDATFYEKKFLYLCDEIYQATEVLPEHQVILVSGGSTICMDKKVKTFNAGTCSNPFFLFSKINCKYRDIVFEELCDEYKFLKNEHKLVLSMEVSLDCIKSRTNLAKSCYRLSKKYFDRLTKDIKAQHFQNQGWNTAISNITAVSEAFKKRSQIFISNFEKFLRNAEKNSMILFKFDEAIAILNDLKLFSQIFDIQDDVTISNVNTLETTPVNLYEWIIAVDSISSFDDLIEESQNDFETVNDEAYQKISTSSAKVIELIDKDTMREVAGLEKRLSHLNIMFENAKTLILKQELAAKEVSAITQNIICVGDSSKYSSACHLLLKKLYGMTDTLKKLYDVMSRCTISKNEVCHNLGVRLRWIIYTQKLIVEVDNDIVLYNSIFRNNGRRMNIVRQIYEAPALYVKLLYESTRRYEYSELLRSWILKTSKIAQKLYQDECSRREKIDKIIDTNFLRCMFQGLMGIPPKFATEPLLNFDEKLIHFDKSEIDQLKKTMEEKFNISIEFNDTSIEDFKNLVYEQESDTNDGTVNKCNFYIPKDIPTRSTSVCSEPYFKIKTNSCQNCKSHSDIAEKADDFEILQSSFKIENSKSSNLSIISHHTTSSFTDADYLSASESHLCVSNHCRDVRDNLSIKNKQLVSENHQLKQQIANLLKEKSSVKTLPTNINNNPQLQNVSNRMEEFKLDFVDLKKNVQILKNLDGILRNLLLEFFSAGEIKKNISSLKMLVLKNTILKSIQNVTNSLNYLANLNIFDYSCDTQELEISIEPEQLFDIKTKLEFLNNMSVSLSKSIHSLFSCNVFKDFPNKRDISKDGEYHSIDIDDTAQNVNIDEKESKMIDVTQNLDQMQTISKNTDKAYASLNDIKINDIVIFLKCAEFGHFMLLHMYESVEPYYFLNTSNIKHFEELDNFKYCVAKIEKLSFIDKENESKYNLPIGYTFILVDASIIFTSN